MQEPTLVILAAGMGSRFGGLKHITAVDYHGHAIIDFSLYDAYRAGFRKVAFIIKHEIEEDFKSFIGKRVEKYFEVKYIYQQLEMLPEGYAVPEGRVKPWGTGHAVLCCKGAVDGPFAVINSDDYYGRSAYQKLYEFLTSDRPGNEHAMVAYLLKNTVTENGSVARGVCQVNGEGFLESVVERTKIEKQADGVIRFTEDGSTWICLPEKTTVSMNMWGFTPSFAAESEARFPAFLDKALAENPMKGEYFLPSTVSALLAEDKATVKMLYSPDKWYGVTYAADKPVVVAALKTMTEQGLYPDGLWK